MKLTHVLLLLCTLVLSSCGIDFPTSCHYDDKRLESWEHKFGAWFDTGYKDPKGDSIQQEHTCATCGLKELRWLTP